MQEFSHKSAQVPVQDSARCRTNCFREQGKKLPKRLRIGKRGYSLLGRFCIAIVGQQALARSKPVLKSDQTFVRHVRPAEINLFGPRRFAFLDYLPEQKRHPTKIVKFLVRATVLV